MSGPQEVRVCLNVKSSRRLTGELGILFPCGEVALVALNPRHVRLLLALEAWEERSAAVKAANAARDETYERLFGSMGSPALAPEELGNRYGRVEPPTTDISVRTVRTYVSEIGTAIDKAVAALGKKVGSSRFESPRLISHDQGYRLGSCGLRVFRADMD